MRAHRVSSSYKLQLFFLIESIITHHQTLSRSPLHSALDELHTFYDPRAIVQYWQKLETLMSKSLKKALLIILTVDIYG